VCPDSQLLVSTNGLPRVAGRLRLLDALEGQGVVMGRNEDDGDGQSLLKIRPLIPSMCTSRYDHPHFVGQPN